MGQLSRCSRWGAACAIGYGAAPARAQCMILYITAHTLRPAESTPTTSVRARQSATRLPPSSTCQEHAVHNVMHSTPSHLSASRVHIDDFGARPHNRPPPPPRPSISQTKHLNALHTVAPYDLQSRHRRLRCAPARDKMRCPRCCPRVQSGLGSHRRSRGLRFELGMYMCRWHQQHSMAYTSVCACT